MKCNLKKVVLLIGLFFPVLAVSSPINDIRASASKWHPQAVEKAHGKLVVILNEEKISDKIYQSILIEGICSLTWSGTNTSMDDVENILVINQHKTQGLVFEGGKAECMQLKGLSSGKMNSMVMAITRDF